MDLNQGGGGMNSVFANDIAEFLSFRNDLGQSEYSFKTYLRIFDEYVCECVPNARQLTQGLVIGWLKFSHEQGSRGIPNRALAIRSFGKYLISMGKDAYVLPYKYSTNGKTFVPTILTPGEISAFFKATDEIKKWHCGDRFTPSVAPVLFRLMYTCGLRPTEARELGVNDVNSSTGEILIKRNKSKKERIVVMSDDMLQMCQQYEGKRKSLFVRTDYYFPRVDGTMYTAQQLNHLCRKYWQRANPDIPKEELPRLRPYDFRHGFASSVLQKWLDEKKDLYTMLPYLRAYLGHEHIEDTAYYIHVIPERLLKSPGINWDEMDLLMPEVSIWEN